MEEMHQIIFSKNLRTNRPWKYLINKKAYYDYYISLPNTIIKMKLCETIEKNVNKNLNFDKYIEYYADDEEYYDAIYNLCKKNHLNTK
jgi:hypothetical protein